MYHITPTNEIKEVVSQHKLFGTFLSSLENVRVQSGFQKELVLRDRQLEDFYEGEYVDFIKSDVRPDDWLKDHPIVYAKNAEELLFHVRGRGINFSRMRGSNIS